MRHFLSTQRLAPRVIECDGLVIDFDAMVVTRDGGDPVHLQARDARVLQLIVESAPRVVNRSELLDRAWGEDQFPTPRAVDNAVVRLRDALGETAGRRIRSIRGIGYQWIHQ